LLVCYRERREVEAREMEKVKMEQERLEKQRAEQAVHKHFAESFRLAQKVYHSLPVSFLPDTFLRTLPLRCIRFILFSICLRFFILMFFFPIDSEVKELEPFGL